MPQQSARPRIPITVLPPPVERPSLTRRFFAYMIDLAILAVVGGGLILAGGITSLPSAWHIIAVAAAAAYFVGPYSTSGQTLGKHALKIKVISIDGSPLTWRQGVLRTFGYIVDAIPLGFGYLWAFWDADDQAFHDKLAGTCVVPAAVAAEELQGRMARGEVRGTQRRWLLRLGIPALVVLGFQLLMPKSVPEVRAMRPWPRAHVPAGEVVSVDLAHLGLWAAPVWYTTDRSALPAGCEEGAVATFESDDQTVLTLWAYRYESIRAAAQEFASYQTAQEFSCQRGTTAEGGSTGAADCEGSDAYEKLLWNGRWIVHIIVMKEAGHDPEVLVDQARDAMATHWRAMR